MENERHTVTAVAGYSSKIFWVLFSGCLFGLAAVMPYVLALVGIITRSKPLPVSPAFLVVAQLIQGGLLFALAVFVGSRLVGKVGIEAPFLDYWLGRTTSKPPKGAVSVPVWLGAGSAVVLVIILRFFVLPHIGPSPLDLDRSIALWKRFLACFYGGINEEIFMRWFVLSLLLWLLKWITRTRSLRPAPIWFWLANLIVALLFGLGHLGVTKLGLEITPLVLAILLSVNAIFSLLFGYLYWSRGIEAAMLAHFSADLILHVVGPLK